MNKAKIMTFLSVAGLFVAGATPALAASSDESAQSTAATSQVTSQKQIRSGECDGTGAQEKNQDRLRTKDAECDGTGQQANAAGNQYANGQANETGTENKQTKAQYGQNNEQSSEEAGEKAQDGSSNGANGSQQQLKDGSCKE